MRYGGHATIGVSGIPRREFIHAVFLAIVVSSAALVADDHQQFVNTSSSKGFLWMRFGVSGWNNQRQQLMAAVWVARALRRTLLVPSMFNPSIHDKKRTPVASVFNLTTLREFVDVDFRTLPAHLKPARIVINPNCPGITPSYVRQVVVQAGRRDLLLVMHWAWSDHTFSFNSSEGAVSFWPSAAAFWQSFQVLDVYNRCAASVVASLQSTCRGGLHATHMRVGDRNPWPMIDCENATSLMGRPFRTMPRYQNCENAGKDLTMAQALLVDPGPTALGQDSCIYVATNFPSHPLMKHFREEINRSRSRVFTFSDITNRMQDECHTCHPSVLEQLIVAYVPGRYMATYPSSWDEFSLHLRVQLGGKLRAEEDLTLFQTKLRSNLLLDLLHPLKKSMPQPKRCIELHM
mmetsp:Transcript_18018/g.43551  ORF Transcript_18018/g.43551 Transcript_18018/m.43551 type:complete len:405 (-) Transcript_18018:281-1495(-)